MTKKRVLILSASIGTGHTQAARAIEEYLKTIPEECDVEQLDFLSNEVLSFDNLVKETYIKILDVFPMLYDLMYYSSQGYRKGLVVKTLIAWGLKRRMLRVVAEKKPDILVFTHPFPAGAAALLKRQHRLNIPFIDVITDFDVHPLWVYPQIDTYCVPASFLKTQLTQQGLAADKIQVTGIPIRQAFHAQRWQWDAGHAEKKDVLIMGGGLGMGSIKESLYVLDKLPLIDHFTVVTGYNADLYDELMKMRGHLTHPVEVLGYTNHIPELMQRAALLLTKPGALTCTEATTVRVPMVLYSPIPGQEEANASYMQRKGCARWVKRQDDLAPVINQLLAQPEALQAMSKAASTCHCDGARLVGKEIFRRLQPERFAASDRLAENL